MSDLAERLRDAASISAAYYPKDLNHPPLLRAAAAEIERLRRLLLAEDSYALRGCRTDEEGA